jgi:hypothetical protein
MRTYAPLNDEGMASVMNCSGITNALDVLVNDQCIATFDGSTIFVGHIH